MSITDELRDYIKEQQWCAKGMLTAIADRIDAAHEEAIVSVMNDALYHANDKDMADFGFVRLPKDADGEYIHVGDVMEWVDEPCDHFTVNGIGDNTLFYFDEDTDSLEWTNAERKRHHKQPTVEDTLHELIGKALMLSEIDGENELVAEYAKRLTLRGDGE